MSLVVLIINPTNKKGYAAYPLFDTRGYPLFNAQNHSFCNAHWAYKGYYLFRVNIKPTKPTTSTSRAYQKVYRVSQD